MAYDGAVGRGLNSIYSNSSPFVNSLLIPENDPIQQVQNYQTRIGLTGQQVPEQEHAGLKNALLKTLDILDRPANAIRLGAWELTKGHTGEQAWHAMGEGWRGEDHVYGSDILSNLGVKNGVARTVGGFVTDVLLDPTTYLTGGTAAGLRNGFAKGLAMNGLGGSSAKKAIMKYLPAEVGKSNQELLATTARVLGRDVKPIDSAIPSVEQDILTRGWNAVNPDTIEQSRSLMRTDLKATEQELGQLNQSLGSAIGSALGGGISKLISGKNLDVKGYSDLMDSFTQAASKTRQALTIDDRAKLLANLFPSTPEGLRDFGVAMNGLGMFTDQELKLANLFNNTFDMVGKEALTTGQKVAGALIKNGEVKDLQPLVKRYGTIIEKRETKDGLETAIKFANGLEQVYNETMKATYLKFMGVPFLNVTETLGRGARAFDTMLATSKFAQQNPIGQRLYGAIDATKYIFDTGHISRKILANTREYKLKDGTVITRGEAKYAGAKSMVNLITQHTRKETALAQEAKYLAENLFGDIVNNQKLRRATIIAIEGMAEDADKWAKELWDKELKTLTDAELSVVQSQVTRHAMFANAMFEGDIGDIERRMLELGQTGDEGVGKLKYSARDNYAFHLYEENFGYKMEDTLSPRSERERLIAKQNPKRSHMHERQFQSLAMAEDLTGGELKPVYDIVASFAARAYESRKAAIQNEFITDMEHMLKNPDQFPGIREVISKSKKPGFVQLPDAFNKYYGTPEIKQQMMRLITEPETNAGWGYWKGVMDEFTNMLKTLQTSLNPSFLLRNIVGETMMNWFGNVGIKAHGIATQVMADQTKGSVVRVGDSYFLNGVPLIRRRMVDGKEVVDIGKAYRHPAMDEAGNAALQGTVKSKYEWSNGLDRTQIGWIDDKEPFDVHVKKVLEASGLPTYEINGQKYLAYELMQMFYDNGLGWSGVTKGNLVENMRDLVKAKTMLNRPVEGMKSVGDATETWTRLAHFVDRLDNGLDVKSAAQDVRCFHVDYRDLTSTEKNVFRRIAPYYTYMRKNTPIQFRQMFLNPGKFAMINHLVQEGYNALQYYDPDNYAHQAFNTPDYLRESLAIPWDIDNNGNVRYMNWNLPINDVARLQFSTKDFVNTNLVDMLHPFVKAPIELYQNKSLGTGAEVIRYEGQTSPLFSGWQEGPTTGKVSDYIMSQLGVLNTIRGSAGQIMQAASSQEMPGKPFVGWPVALTMTKSLFPRVNSQQAGNSEAYEYRDQLQDYAQMLKNEQGIELPDVPQASLSERIMQHFYNQLEYDPKKYLRRGEVTASDFY